MPFDTVGGNAVSDHTPRPLLMGAALVALVWSILPASPARAQQSVWIVNSSSDGGGACSFSSCTLRAAIAAANSSPGSDVIQFDIEPPGRYVLRPGSQLPAITGNDVVLDASTQPGGGGLGIRLDDPDAGGGESGLVLEGSRTTVRGFIITGFDRHGIHVQSGSRDNVIQGNWIGTPDGVSDDGNQNDGIRIKGGGGNLIGGTGTGQGNVISAGENDGLEIEDSSDNVVIGNFVGMTSDGRSRLPNEDSGVEINGVSLRNRVGGTTAAERNVISGNDGIGVQILGSMRADGTCETPEFNVIQGNYLGVNIDGRMPGSYGNTGEGAQMSTCARNNLLGGTDPGAGNVISGNRADGVELDSSGGPGGAQAVCDNTIQGNFIGTDPSGMLRVPNVDDGIGLDNGVCDTLVGGATPAARNVISANFNDGVDVSRPGSNGNVVQGNLIGLGVDGRGALGNGQNGVHIRFKAQSNRVVGNVISSNAQSGVRLTGNLTDLNEIRDNRIGTDAAGAISRGNSAYGVSIYDGPKRNLITVNHIQANRLDGVAVEKVPGSLNTTVRNRIDHNRIQGNGGLGIDLLPQDGVNPNDGATSASVGNLGLDFPVILEASSTSVRGTAPPFASVEVFQAVPGPGETHGEGALSVGSTAADATGAWCLAELTATGEVTATATDADGNTSEFAANEPIQGTAVLCSGGGDITLFSDSFTGPDGTVPPNWEIRRSAAGTGAGAFLDDGRLRVNVFLSPVQDGTWQYVQARETPVQPDWGENTIRIRWQMEVPTVSDESASLVLTPNAATGNAVSQPDYLRFRIHNGVAAIVVRVAGSSPQTLSGSPAATAGMQEFELRLTRTQVSVFQGPPDQQVRLTGPIDHGLTWVAGYPYLHASASSSPGHSVLFDEFLIQRSAS
jgi:hypothetical protein